jgi:WD40 repeat protein
VSQTVGLDGEAAVNALLQYCTDHSGRLTEALRRANERAWRALELALAGETFWERCKLLAARADDKAFGLQVRAFLDAAPLPEFVGKTRFRQAVLAELREARKARLLTGGTLEAQELARRAGVFLRFSDPEGILKVERQVTRDLAHEVGRAGYGNLAWFLDQRPPQCDPLLVIAVRYFFRREIESDAELFRGLAWTQLEALVQAQETGFASLAAALDRHSDRLTELLAGIQDVAVATHGGVLDLKAEQGRQGALLAGLYEQVLEQHRRFDVLERHLRREDRLSIRGDAERQLVRALVSRFRALPADQQRQLPALLNALAKLQVLAGQLDEAQQDFGTLATTVTEPTARAEAHFNAYQTALGRRDWILALEELLRAVRLDAQQFAPFPMGKYHPKCILGAGGFGVAFLCRHKDLDADVVVKALRDDAPGRDVEEVLTEARVLHRLEHPCVVHVLNCGYTAPKDRARPYFVMRYFDGVTLQEQVRDGPLSVDDCLIVARKMAEGLRAAHAQGILHRDVKPANVLVRRDGSDWQVKLIDFGLSLRSEALHDTGREPSTDDRPAAGGEVAGTLDYAAPEQMGRLPGVAAGPFSDVYGLAKTCCYALFRTTQPLPKHWEAIPAPLRKLLGECLEEDPAARPADCAAVVARLDALRRGEASGPSSRSPLEPLGATWTWLKEAARPLLSGGARPSGGAGATPTASAPGAGSSSGGMPRPHLVFNDAKHGRIIVDLTPENAFSALLDAFVAFGVQEIVSDHRTLILVGKTGAKLWSFGQAIKGAVESTGQGSLVTVTSRPSGQIYDWGRGRKEAQQILDLMINRITAVPQGPDRTRPAASDSAPAAVPATRAAPATAGTPPADPGRAPAEVAQEALAFRLVRGDRVTGEREVAAEVVKGALAFMGHKGPVLSLSFAPDAGTFISAGADGSARLWDLRGKELLRLRLPTRGIELTQPPHEWFRAPAVVHGRFAPDGSRVLLVDADGAVWHWNLKSGDVVRRFHVPGGIAAAALSPDGRQLLVGVKRAVSLWDVEQGRLIFALGGRPGDLTSDIQCVAFTPRGAVLAGDTSGVALVYGGNQRLRLQGHTGRVCAIAAHPNGRHLLTGSADHRLFVWDLERGEGWPLTGHTAGVLGVAVSPDGHMALSGGVDQTVRLWRLKDRKPDIWFTGHTDQVRCVAFSPLGRQAVSGGDDGVIRLWPVNA